MAQLGARFNGIEEVRGSNPLRSTNSSPNADFGAEAHETQAASHEHKQVTGSSGIAASGFVQYAWKSDLKHTRSDTMNSNSLDFGIFGKNRNLRSRWDQRSCKTRFEF